MKTSKIITVILLTATGALLTTGCVYRERTVYRSAPPVAVAAGEEVVTEAPPAPVTEVVTVAPAPGLVWIGGIYVWHRHHWVWERGHWARPPHPGAVWVPHHYVYRNGVHVFVRGGWR